MIELSISGKSEGPVASSSLDMFSFRTGSISEILSKRLQGSPEISLPFEVLGIFIAARSHDSPQKRAKGANAIGVRSTKELLRFKTGQLLKSYELILNNENFYSLSTREKHQAIARAFERVAGRVSKEFPDPSGAALAQQITSAAEEYSNRQLAGPAA